MLKFEDTISNNNLVPLTSMLVKNLINVLGIGEQFK